MKRTKCDSIFNILNNLPKMVTLMGQNHFFYHKSFSAQNFNQIHCLKQYVDKISVSTPTFMSSIKLLFTFWALRGATRSSNNCLDIWTNSKDNSRQNGELRSWNKNSSRSGHWIYCKEYRYGQNPSWGKDFVKWTGK